MLSNISTIIYLGMFMLIATATIGQPNRNPRRREQQRAIAGGLVFVFGLVYLLTESQNTLLIGVILVTGALAFSYFYIRAFDRTPDNESRAESSALRRSQLTLKS